MRRAAVALVLMGFAAHADARTLHGLATNNAQLIATCPRGALYADGCAAALAGRIQHPTFFTSYALGSDISARRPPWNVAGVEYGVGQISADTALADATVNANLPGGCTFNSSSDTVNCSGSGSLTLAHLDFTHGGAGVRLYVHTGSFSTITLFDDHFLNGSLSDNTANLIRIDNQAVPNALVIQNVTFDANGAKFTSKLSYIIQEFRNNGAGATTSITYSACLNIVGKCWASMQGMAVHAYNYFEAYEHGVGNANHQETYLIGNGVLAPFTDSFNTYLQPATVATGATNGTVGFVYLSTGAANFEVQSATVSNDTFVAAYNASMPFGAAIALSYGQYDALTFTNNYAYMPNAVACVSLASSPSGAGLASPTMLGNVDMVDGAAITGFGACP